MKKLMLLIIILIFSIPLDTQGIDLLDIYIIYPTTGTFVSVGDIVDVQVIAIDTEFRETKIYSPVKWEMETYEGGEGKIEYKNKNKTKIKFFAKKKGFVFLKAQWNNKWGYAGFQIK